MKAKNTTPKQLKSALAATNKQYKNNLEFERFDANSKSVEFTLRVRSSKGPGHRIGCSGRKMAKACWHAHGDFFDQLLLLNPSTVIISRGGPGAVIDIRGGNWQDCNIGSQVQPLMMSEACECDASGKIFWD